MPSRTPMSVTHYVLLYRVFILGFAKLVHNTGHSRICNLHDRGVGTDVGVGTVVREPV